MYERLKFALSMKKLLDDLFTKQIATLVCLSDVLSHSTGLGPVREAIHAHYNTAIKELFEGHKKAIDEISAFIGEPLEVPEPDYMSEPEAAVEVLDRR